MMQMELYQKYHVASIMSKSPEVYTSIALAVIWISECFTLSLSRKFHLLIFYNIYL